MKFADGTMICWLKTNSSSIDVTAAYGSLFTNTYTWNFPESFSANPTVSCGRFQYGTGGSWGTVSSAASNTSAQLRIIDVTSRAAGTTTYIEAIAIGKWK
jgi:hypothetical protein